MSQSTDPREIARGLRELADLLDSNPDLPTRYGNNGIRVSIVTGGGDDADRAEVDRIAAVLGTTPSTVGSGSSHYEAVRTFSGGVVYEATAISSAWMAGYEARHSYSRNVQPETAAP